MQRIDQWLRWGRGQLETSSATPALDAEVLICHLLKVNRAYCFAHGDARMPEHAITHFRRQIERRRQGVPVAYLTGECEFYGLSLRLNPSVLVPRPETELLVDRALELIPAQADWRIADLGTGSGAIALAIAHHRPNCRLIATDVSPAALRLAGANARQLGLQQRIEWHQGDWTQALPGQFHLILSNPPYVDASDRHLQDDSLAHEPLTALTPGENALSALSTIIQQTPKHLFNKGWLILEHGYDQGEAVQQLMLLSGYQQLETLRDVGGQQRVTAGCRS
ncbi:MAG: peptide chain release factor N(5)-glutamine methyltransferase [Wenzhouxiangellaceae bacterium]